MLSTHKVAEEERRGVRQRKKNFQDLCLAGHQSNDTFNGLTALGSGNKLCWRQMSNLAFVLQEMSFINGLFTVARFLFSIRWVGGGSGKDWDG